ncbi:hypothetical protein D3C87_1755590 [compost metagenome]
MYEYDLRLIALPEVITHLTLLNRSVPKLAIESFFDLLDLKFKNITFGATIPTSVKLLFEINSIKIFKLEFSKTLS